MPDIQPLVAANSIRKLPRSRLRKLAGWATVRLAVGLHAVCGDRRLGGFGILMYHRVTDNIPGVETPTNNVPPALLHKQLAGLLARGFRPWPLQKLLAASEQGEPIPPNVFAVTFDDGYENNLLEALPILQELEVPATIFLATAFLDTREPMPSDNWSAAGSPQVPTRSWRTLSTEQCHELLASGLVELAAHTHTHQMFSGRTDDFRRDLVECVAVLRNRFGIERPTFAFPFGVTNPDMVAAAQRRGRIVRLDHASRLRAAWRRSISLGPVRRFGPRHAHDVGGQAQRLVFAAGANPAGIAATAGDAGAEGNARKAADQELFVRLPRRFVAR